VIGYSCSVVVHQIGHEIAEDEASLLATPRNSCSQPTSSLLGRFIVAERVGFEPGSDGRAVAATAGRRS